MRRFIPLLVLLSCLIDSLIPVGCYAFDDPTQWKEWEHFSQQEKQSVGRTYIWKEQERRDMFVAACLKSYAEQGRSYNDQWHQEIEAKSITCAYRLLNALDALDKSTQPKERKNNENPDSSR